MFLRLLEKFHASSRQQTPSVKQASATDVLLETQTCERHPLDVYGDVLSHLGHFSSCPYELGWSTLTTQRDCNPHLKAALELKAHSDERCTVSRETEMYLYKPANRDFMRQCFPEAEFLNDALINSALSERISLGLRPDNVVQFTREQA